ncbi:hypothetical protein RHO15_03905 [Utexia brackfieldae]|uniref:PilN domain-containing protein n=1 Tax=Utexia brackfieldae TaxID=3074108 RepID=UPI00370D5C57
MRAVSLLVGLDIQDQVIIVVIVAKKHPEQVVCQFEVLLSAPVLAYGQLINPSLLADKLHEIVKQLPIGCEYLLCLAENQTLTQHLALPKGIAPHEYDMIVATSLPRLFALNEREIVYDYIADETGLTITAAKRQTITGWQNLFSQLARRLVCISVKRPLSEIDFTDKSPFFYAQQLLITHDRCLNFLPWRAKLYTFRRSCFLLFGLLYLMIGLIFLILIGLHYRELLRTQMVLVTQRNDELQLKNTQLVNLVTLNERVAQFKQMQKASVAIRQSSAMLLAHFIHIAKALPEQVWLEKLDYDNFIFQLTGKSLTEEGISRFMAQLCVPSMKRDCQLNLLQQPDISGFTFEIDMVIQHQKENDHADALF